MKTNNEQSVVSPRVAIACGGTGGHLFPGFAVARQLRERGCRVSLFLSPKAVDQQAALTAPGLEVFTLPAVASGHGRWLKFLLGSWHSWRACRRVFAAQPPQAVLAMGGFTSAPPIMAGRSLGAATFLHEANAIPGRANRWLACFVDLAFVGFPLAATRLRRCEVIVTGTPVRLEFRPLESDDCRAALGLALEPPVLLVMGGSQGASPINQLMLRSMPWLKQQMPHWQFLHLSGTAEAEQVRAAYLEHGLRAVVHPFMNRVDLALGSATVALSRAGASSLAEIAAVRVPTLLIPFPGAADNHQLFNARAYAQSGAALLLEQAQATPDRLVSLLKGLAEDEAARARMKQALVAWHAPEAQEFIADIIITEMQARSNGQLHLEPVPPASLGLGRVAETLGRAAASTSPLAEAPMETVSGEGPVGVEAARETEPVLAQ